jgi:acetoacetyl-CoA synthetase
MVVDLEYLGRPSFMPLFVVLRPGSERDRTLIERIKQQIRTKASGRHVPDAVVQVGEIPRTLSGKKMEVPVRKILLGVDLGQVTSPDAMQNPSSLDFFTEYAKTIPQR